MLTLTKRNNLFLKKKKERKKRVNFKSHDVDFLSRTAQFQKLTDTTVSLENSWEHQGLSTHHRLNHCVCCHLQQHFLLSGRRIRSDCATTTSFFPEALRKLNTLLDQSNPHLLTNTSAHFLGFFLFCCYLLLNIAAILPSYSQWFTDHCLPLTDLMHILSEVEPLNPNPV